jgi:hypothetical protein
MVARAPTEQLCGTVPPASATTAWQVAFLVTGEFREFTDASHLEIEHPELLERGGSPT